MIQLSRLQGKININMKCECYDKDGNLKWTDGFDMSPSNDVNINNEETKGE